MCRWMGSHFHDWIDYNGVALSTELLEWGRTFPDFLRKKVYLNIRLTNLPDVFIVGEKWVNSFSDDLFKSLIR